MSPWKMLVESLATRPQPTPDELRDARNAETKRARLAAFREANARQNEEKIAATENKVFSLAKATPGITFAELAEAMHVTQAYIRIVTKRMLEDGRLSVKAGTTGKKYWYANL